MSYKIHLEKFEGPFDLLLFLIQKNEIDIYDIPIATITNQFIDYINRVGQINLSHAGEFIEMVSTLMQIKARMLLPNPQKESDELHEDPRTELVHRILEYRQYQEVAETLTEIEKKHTWIKSRAYFKFLEDIHYEAFEEDASPLNDITLYDLIKAFRKVLDAIPKITEYQIKKITVSIEDTSNKIRNYLTQSRMLYFSKLIEDASDKIVVVVSFISMLELTKAREINLSQEHLFDDICITKNQHDYEASHEN